MSAMPDSTNNNRNDASSGGEGEESSQIHGPDHSRASSLRDFGVDTQPQSSEPTDTLTKREHVLEKIHVLLGKLKHDSNKEGDEYYQEGQGKDNRESSRKDSAEKQVVDIDIDDLKHLLEELKSLGPEENVNYVTTLAIGASPSPPKVIEALIEAGALVDKAQGDGYPLLHHACRYGHTSTVRKIIELRQTSINQPATVWELTPLHVAAMYGKKSVVETLLDAGPEIHINSQDADGWTPLMAATIEEYVDVMHVLLMKKEIEVDKPDNDGLTPLFVATKRRFFEGVKKLLGEGADCNAGPDGGEKCLHWAM